MTDGFNVASPEEIKAGRVTDVYFERGREVIEAEEADAPVVAEIRVTGFPRGWPWGVLAGLDEAVALLEGHDVEVKAVREGSVFYAEEPVMVLEGNYLAFGVLETALLGVLCQASGVATAAARTKLAAAGRPVYSFGARRMHPAIAPMIERAAYVGGFDGVAVVKSAELLGIPPVGTMAHALVLLLGDERAWRAFDRVVDASVPRVALVDTFLDEKIGAVAAARVLGDRLTAVRLDTPASRRGDFVSILREVRWELDANGFANVRIFVSGGIDETSIPALNRYVDSYGVGTSVSNAPVMDFSLDIVEVKGEPRAKRGKLSGRKHLWGCENCGNRGIAPGSARLGDCPRCNHRVRSLLRPAVKAGKRTGAYPSAAEVRAYALREVEKAPDPLASR
ncbi:MAG: nicotinate phosphoribosyltransferase [Actinobacteria bacterium]|nr:nicotinate phosphoribosyltransferase [Actinomycetota bacterium]